MSEYSIESRFTSDDPPRVDPDPELAARCREYAHALQASLLAVQDYGDKLDSTLHALKEAGLDAATITGVSMLGEEHVKAILNGETSLEFALKALASNPPPRT